MQRNVALTLAVAATALVCLPLAADDVYLTNGSVFEGVVAEVGEEHVSVELPYGRLKLPRSQVSRVVESETPLEVFRNRRSDLLLDPASTAESFLELARWASLRGLERDARETALLAARLSPDHEGLAPVLTALGYVDDEVLGWVPVERSMTRRGYVRHGGDWLSPDEHRARLELERERLALERERAEEARSAASDRAGSQPGASANDVALEAVRLARDVARGETVGRTAGFGFMIGAPPLIPALPLSGSFAQLPAADSSEPAPTSRLQIDWDTLAQRQPGSFIPMSAQRRQLPRR